MNDLLTSIFQISSFTCINHFQEDLVSTTEETLLRTFSMKRTLVRQQNLALKEQRYAHRQSLCLLREEYAELQLSIATNANKETILLREEHQSIVTELVEMFQQKCLDLVTQRDEYAEEAEIWRRRAER